MSEMIERVAAVLEKFYGGPSPVEAALAVIAAMREPTEAMVEASYVHHNFARDGPGGPSPELAWRAMIDEALKL